MQAGTSLNFRWFLLLNKSTERTKKFLKQENEREVLSLDPEQCHEVDCVPSQFSVTSLTWNSWRGHAFELSLTISDFWMKPFVERT